MHAQRPARTARLLLLPAAALVVAPLAGCGDDEAAGSDSSITVDDAWVKATEATMTGSFGVITNAGDSDLVVVSAETSVSDTTELHEVVMSGDEMVMRQKDGGFVVPAGGEHILEPGSDHVMIMNLQQPVEPGDEIDITLTFDDGGTVTYSGQAREAEVGDETYVPGDESMDEGAGMSDDAMEGEEG
jgi:copper(I)-binding protein